MTSAASKTIAEKLHISYQINEVYIEDNPVAIFTAIGPNVSVSPSGEVTIWDFLTQKGIVLTPKGEMRVSSNFEEFSVQTGTVMFKTELCNQYNVQLPDYSLVEVSPFGEITYLNVNTGKRYEISPNLKVSVSSIS